MQSDAEERKARQQNSHVAQNDGRYKTLFEQVNAAAFLASLDGQILEANQRSCELFNYDWNELLRLSLRNLLPLQTDWEQLKEEIAARGGLHLETESVGKDGSYTPVELSISLFQMDKKPMIFVLLWDISDRRTSEQRLRESEKKYRGLFEYTTDAIIVLDAHGDILDVNTTSCELFNFLKDQFIGKNLFNMGVLTAESSPVVLNQFQQLLSRRNATTYTSQVKTQNGNVLDVEISSFFLVRKENEVDNFVLIVRDVTHRNTMEQRRIEEHTYMKTLWENIPDSVYFKDENHQFILVNKSKAQHYQIDPDEMLGKTDFDFLPEDQAKKSFEDDKTILQTGRPIINKVEKVVHRDGSEHWMSVTKIPRYNAEGDIIGTMGISRDITPAEQARKDLELSEKRYRAVFENSSFAIILTDDTGTILSWNSLVETLFGFTYQDLHMKSLSSLYTEEVWKQLHRSLFTSENTTDHLETLMHRKDGHAVDVVLSVSHLQDDQGGVVGTTILIQDISKQREIEHKWKDEHVLFTSLMDTIPDSIYFKDSNNRFVFVNKVKAEHWNVTPEEMIGKTDFDFLPPDQAQKAVDDDNQIMQSRQPLIDQIEKITGSDGLERWFSVTKVPRFDDQNNVIGTIGISRNVTNWIKLDAIRREKFLSQ